MGLKHVQQHWLALHGLMHSHCGSRDPWPIAAPLCTPSESQPPAAVVDLLSLLHVTLCMLRCASQSAVACDSA